MTTGTVKSQGTRMYFCLPGSTSEIHKVACPSAINGLGGAANQIDKTCLDSVEMEYDRGMQNPGQVSVPINFIPRSAAHQALIDLRASGDTTDWMIVLSDQAGAPADVDSDGHLVSPGSTTVRFQGYIADMTIDVPKNDIVRATLSIQRSGAPEWDLPAADLD